MEGVDLADLFTSVLSILPCSALGSSFTGPPEIPHSAALIISVLLTRGGRQRLDTIDLTPKIKKLWSYLLNIVHLSPFSVIFFPLGAPPSEAFEEGLYVAPACLSPVRCLFWVCDRYAYTKKSLPSSVHSIPSRLAGRSMARKMRVSFLPSRTQTAHGVVTDRQSSSSVFHFRN